VIRYHLRAWRYRKTLWESHAEGVAEFLQGWDHPRHIVVIGPSGGYSLPMDWLARLESLTVIEPDPVGRAVFASKLLPLQLLTRFVNQRLNFEDPAFLRPYIAKDTGVLFANVLGQVRVSDPRAFTRSMSAALHGWNWASYHDRLSGRERLWRTPVSMTERIATKDLLEEGAGGELQEHLASDLLAPLGAKKVQYWDWRISPRQIHLIEGMASS
jgi:hypothetical protein